jgi:hypothetical protein
LELGLLVVLNRDQFPFEQNRPIVVDPAGEVVWTYDTAHPTPGPEIAE